MKKYEIHQKAIKSIYLLLKEIDKPFYEIEEAFSAEGGEIVSPGSGIPYFLTKTMAFFFRENGELVVILPYNVVRLDNKSKRCLFSLKTLDEDLKTINKIVRRIRDE